MGWNYRVVRQREKRGETCVAIREVHYSGAKAESVAVESTLSATTVTTLLEEIEKCRLACDQPILELSELRPCPGDDESCSFCGKDKVDVRRLIQGGGTQPARVLPVVCICDECITLCAEIVAGK